MAEHSVRLHYRATTISVAPGKTLAECLAEVGLAERRLLAVREGTLLDGAELLRPGDEVQLLDEISGGGH